jgi:hypothetical protein
LVEQQGGFAHLE